MDVWLSAEEQRKLFLARKSASKRFKRKKAYNQCQKKNFAWGRKPKIGLHDHFIRSVLRHQLIVSGVGKFCKRKSPVRRLVRIFAVTVIFFLMCYMTYKVVNEYFEYKKTVEQTNVIADNMEFPAVTICSSNTLPQSVLKEVGGYHIVHLQEFLSNREKVKKHYEPLAERRRCISNPACEWSWFRDSCTCFSNPCLTEICDFNYPTCKCDARVCKFFPKICVPDTSQKQTESCLCQNNRSDNVRTTTPANTSISELPLGKPENELYRLIGSTAFEKVNEIQWKFRQNITIPKESGLQFDNFVLACSYHAEPCSERNFTTFYTPMHGKCFTFNYAGELSDDPNKKILITKRYGLNSGLQLYIQINQSELVDFLDEDVGVRVVIHDPLELPYVAEYSFIVRPGDSAQLDVERHQYFRIGKPFGNCLTSGEHLPFNYTDQPYSQLGCRRYCQNFYLQKNCNCKRKSLILPSKFPLGENELNNFCDASIPSEKKCLRRVIRQIESGVIQCNCHQACSEDLYKASLTAGAINTKFFSFIKSIKTLEKLDNGTYTASFPRDSRTILGLKVYYRTLLLRTISERPAYSWETLVANIGGNLGFFMGLTLITFFEIIEFFCDIILAFLKYR